MADPLVTLVRPRAGLSVEVLRVAADLGAHLEQVKLPLLVGPSAPGQGGHQGPWGAVSRLPRAPRSSRGRLGHRPPPPPPPPPPSPLTLGGEVLRVVPGAGQSAPPGGFLQAYKINNGG